MLNSPKICEQYLFPALDSAKIFGARVPGFNSLPFKLSGLRDVKELLASCRFEKDGIGEIANKSGSIDICVSISCFEHIKDFCGASKALAKLSHEQTIHLHIVNFSNHLSKEQPFHELYEMPYKRFGKLWNYNVNGLRPADMLSELTKAGLALRCITLEKRPEALPMIIDSSWLEAYSHDELSIRTALLTSL